jgi:hypothetical protein
LQNLALSDVLARRYPQHPLESIPKQGSNATRVANLAIPQTHL